MECGGGARRRRRRRKWRCWWYPSHGQLQGQQQRQRQQRFVQQRQRFVQQRLLQRAVQLGNFIVISFYSKLLFFFVFTFYVSNFLNKVLTCLFPSVVDTYHVKKGKFRLAISGDLSLVMHRIASFLLSRSQANFHENYANAREFLTVGAQVRKPERCEDHADLFLAMKICIKHFPHWQQKGSRR